MTSGQGTPSRLAIARHTMASAMIEPTERSMPAVTMTTNMPSASSASEAFCLTMLVRLSIDGKTCGCVQVKTAIITMTTTMMP